ncbi:MAG: hypothetical protein QOG91_551 [Candidatus Parcubacteria bacterium]|jgi:hypothetical protein|nr:hypothetical protein [Candidatus Parcubacteria bacterium]
MVSLRNEILVGLVFVFYLFLMIPLTASGMILIRTAKDRYRRIWDEWRSGVRCSYIILFFKVWVNVGIFLVGVLLVCSLFSLWPLFVFYQRYSEYFERFLR